MLVITSVGTSLLENCRETYRELENDYAYLKDSPAFLWESNQKRIEKVRKVLLSWAKVKEDTSAEIKSLLKIRAHVKEEITGQLIATDTILSRLAAEVLCSVLKKEMIMNFEPEKDVIKGLQVRDRKKFEKEGLVNLAARIEELAPASTETGINITGGYKAIIPYLTILGQVHGHRLYYTFEDTDELILIPQTPVNIDWGLFEKYAHVFQELEEGIYNWEQYKREHNLWEEDFQSCTWEEEGLAELNALGRMFWNRYKNFFLVQVLKGSCYFTESSGNKREVNEALGELYRRLSGQITLNSLTTTAELHQHLISLGSNDDLRHGENPGRDKFIFKSTRKSQIRLVYTPLLASSGLVIKLFDYVRGNFDHHTYLPEFKQKMQVSPFLARDEFTLVSLPKPLILF